MALINIGAGPFYSSTDRSVRAPNGCLVTLLRKNRWGTNEEIRRLLTSTTDTFQPSGAFFIDRYAAIDDGNITYFSSSLNTNPTPTQQELLMVVYPTLNISSTKPGSGTPGFFYRSNFQNSYSDTTWLYLTQGGGVYSLGAFDASENGELPLGTFTAGVCAKGGYGFTTRFPRRVRFESVNYNNTPVSIVKTKTNRQMTLTDTAGLGLESVDPEYDLYFYNVSLPFEHTTENIEGYYKMWFKEKYKRQIIQVTLPSYDPPGPPAPSVVSFLSGFGTRYTTVLQNAPSMTTYTQQLTTTTILGPIPAWTSGPLPTSNYLAFNYNFSGNWQFFKDFLVTVSVSTNNVAIPNYPILLNMEILGWVQESGNTLLDNVITGQLVLSGLSTTPKQFKINNANFINNLYLQRTAISACSVSVVSAIPMSTNLIFHDIRGAY